MRGCDRLSGRRCCALRQAADEALAGVPTPQCLTVDFTAVDACDSSGLSAMIWIKRCTDADGVQLHLGGLDQHVRHVMAITGLDVHLTDALTAPCQDHGEGTAAVTAT